MRIGIDVDGVLTNIEQFQLKYGKEYFKDCKNIDESKFEIEDIFHCTKEESQRFWTKYIWKYCLQEPMVKDMAEVIKLLHNKGAEIYIITRRVHTLRDDLLGIIFRKMLEHFIQKYALPVEDIIYCTDFDGEKNKVQVCKNLNISIMVEDDPKNAEAISQVCQVLCIKTKYNQELKEQNNLTKITGAQDFYNFAVQRLEKRKVSTECSFFQDPFDKSYKTVRKIGVPIFKSLLKPEILHSEFIPTDGPVILCGNHLHVWDQFPVICSTKRTTHWMSKKEYFDGKMGSFFEKTGAICVDRYGDPHKSVKEALNYLEIGSAVGLFPEGTRNGLKESYIRDLYISYEKILNLDYEKFRNFIEQQKPLMSHIVLLQQLYKEHKISESYFIECLLGNARSGLSDMVMTGTISKNEFDDAELLPFKYGAVSMAHKTNATIVPFGVTGDYKIGNDNLMVSFGEPFKVVNDDLDSANVELRQKILRLVNENKKNSI